MSQHSPEQEAFRSLIGAAEDRSSREEWIDSLCYAAGPERELVADARGVYGVRHRETEADRAWERWLDDRNARRRREDVEYGAEQTTPIGTVS